MAQFIRVRDERLNTCNASDATYIVKEGARTSYTVLPPQSVNTGSLVYQLNNVGPNVGRNRQIWVNPQATVVITGTGLTNPVEGQLGLKAWPFNRNISQAQHTINNAPDTYLTNQFIDLITRLKCEATDMRPYDNVQPDNCVDYLTGIAGISPIVNYTSVAQGDVYTPRNVGIVSAIASGGGTVLTVTLNWWEPLITPFSAVGSNNKNLPAIYSIDGETINLVFANGMSDLLAYHFAGATITGQTVNLTSCSIYVEYITAYDLMLPETSLYQYEKFQRFQTPITGGTLAPSSNQTVTVQVNAQTYPSKLLICVRSPETARNASTPDCYASITGIQVQLDNGATLLNGASQRQLYAISRQNGLTDVWPVFAQYNLAGITGGNYYGSGSVLVLDPAKDLSISQEEGLTNSSAGKFTITLNITFSNVQPIVQATAYVFTVNDAVLIRSGRSYNYKLLAYSKEEVANARRSATYIEMHEYDEHKMSNLFLSGGSFKSFFMNLWKNKDKVIHHAKQAYDIGKQAHSLYKEVKGGMPLGGYSLGGSGMKMYYD